MQDAEEKLVGVNVQAPVKEVRHAGLESADEESLYRKRCPVCEKGVLLVGRDLETLKLQEYDRCILCGQPFRYTDIAEMRAAEGV